MYGSLSLHERNWHKVPRMLRSAAELDGKAQYVYTLHNKNVSLVLKKAVASMHRANRIKSREAEQAENPDLTECFKARPNSNIKIHTSA